MGEAFEALVTEVTQRAVLLIQRFGPGAMEQLRAEVQALAAENGGPREAEPAGPGGDGAETDSEGPLQGHVRLNVGGERFLLSQQLLRGDGHADESVRSSYLASLVSEPQSHEILISQSPWTFRRVLEYLMYSQLFDYPEDAGGLEQLCAHADFYGLPDLKPRLRVGLGTYLAREAAPDGEWFWYCRLRTLNSAPELTQGYTTQLVVRAPGVYLISARGLQGPKRSEEAVAEGSWLAVEGQPGGQRTMELHAGKFPPSAVHAYTAGDEPVNTSATRLVPMDDGDTVAVRAEAPQIRYPNCALLAVKVDRTTVWGTWRGKGHNEAWLWESEAGALSPFLVGADERDVSVLHAGRYVVSACDTQTGPHAGALCVTVNGGPVARSYTYAGPDECSCPSTAALTQVLELGPEDRLRVASDAPLVDGEARLLALRVPDGMASASWRAAGADGPVLLWGEQLLGHAEYGAEAGGRRVRLARGGYHLVMLRVAHVGDGLKWLKLWHNNEEVAAYRVTASPLGRNCGHLIEVVHARPGDTVSARCRGLADDAGHLLNNLSIVFLRGD